VRELWTVSLPRRKVIVPLSGIKASSPRGTPPQRPGASSARPQGQTAAPAGWQS
jgi:hypothetical protein